MNPEYCQALTSNEKIAKCKLPSYIEKCAGTCYYCPGPPPSPPPSLPPPASVAAVAPAAALDLAAAALAAATEPSAAVTPVRRLEPRVLPGSDDR